MDGFLLQKQIDSTEGILLIVNCASENLWNLVEFIFYQSIV